MPMQDGLTVLAGLVERLEAGEVVVEDASMARADGEGFDVDLTVHIPDSASVAAVTRGGATDAEQAASPADQPSADPDRSPAGSGPAEPGEGFGTTSVSVGETLGADLRAPSSPPAEAGDAEPPANPATGTSGDEPVACRVEGCDETFESEHGMKIHATKAHTEADGSAPSPHRNPERLREVYDAYDTFEEMTEALDVDVTAQTVRRSMMSLDIHDPDDAVEPSDGGEDDGTGVEEDDGTEADEDAVDGVNDGDQMAADAAPEPHDGAGESATDADDGAGESATDGASEVSEPRDRPDLREVLPSAVDPEVLVTAVREASTLFQVQRAMGMEREEVQNLLAELGLLDVVTGRVSTEDEREVSREEVERRIVEAAGDDPDGDREDPPGAPAEAD